MKKRIIKSMLGAIAVTLSICGLASCNNSTDKPNQEEEDTLTSISLSGGKKEFKVGEDFSVGDLTVKANYSASGEKTITDYTIDSSKVKKNEAGVYEITISYNGKTAKYSVTYVNAEDVLTSISLSGGKKEFKVGEEFSVGDLVVKANYSASGEKTITDYTVDSSKVKKFEVGLYEITISFNGKTAKYNVNYTVEEGVVVYEGFKLKETTSGYSIAEIPNYEYPSILTLPSEYDGKPITEIAELGMTTLKATELIIPSSITKIGSDAFLGNQNICLVDMSACSLTIESGAFYMSGIYAIDLGNTTSIGEDAFADSNLCTVHIPTSVKTIGDNAFNTTAYSEVTFGGATFPTLGKNVFGSRATYEDSIYLYALDSAWNALFEGVDEENKPSKVQEFFSVTYGGYFSTTTEELNKVGIYHGDATIYLNETSLGSKALIICDDYLTVFGLYSSKGISFINDKNERYVLALDSTSKQVERLHSNSIGEYIKNNVLYEYESNAIVYTMTDSIVEVIGGAGLDNPLLRFVTFSKELTTIGDFAFSNGYLFGITFNDKLQSIGEMAFFDQQYIQQIIFKGTTPPVIGIAAFCYFGDFGIVPTIYLNKIPFADNKIYTPLSTSGWWGDPAVQPFVDAFNQSLVEIGDALVKDNNGEFVKYSAGYSGQFGELKSSGLYEMDKGYTSEYGTIYMSGVEKGYAIIDLGETLGYVSISDLVGYKEENSPKKLQIFTGYNEEGISSFITFGSFDLEKETFTLRGIEAGNYGFHNGEKIELDGYGKIVYYQKDGATYIGSYTSENNIITVNEIPNITTITYLSETSSIQINGKDFPALGAESGVYYDYAKHAKIELDGTSINVGETTYSGTLYLTYKGQTQDIPYILENNKIKFTLNETAKEWEFSKDAEVIVSGYYGNYEEMLKFTIAQISSNIDTYTNDTDTLILDGYFTATYNDKEYLYTEIPSTTSIILFMDNENKIIHLNTEDNTFTEADTENTEAGEYYLGNSLNYKLYLDGKGNLLYFDGENKFGNYTYDSSTGEFTIIKWNSEENTPKEKGTIQNGIGSLVYYSYGSDTINAISKTPFVKMPTSWGSFNNYINSTFRYYEQKDGTYSSNSLSLYIYVVNQTVLINTYGKPFVIISLDNAIVDGTIINTQYADMDLTIEFTLTQQDNKTIYSAATSSPNYQYEQITKDDKNYQLTWIDSDKTYLSFYKIETYPTINVYTVTWNNDKTELTFEDNSNIYVISNYGTNDAVLTITAKSE